MARVLVVGAGIGGRRCSARGDGCEAQRLTPHESGVHVLLGHQHDSFDFVIGADGIRSHSRSSLRPHTRLRFSGQVCWRGIVPGSRGNVATEMCDGIQRVGVVPLTGDRSYVYLVRVAPRQSDVSSELRGTGQIGSRRETEAIAALRSLSPEDVLFHELWEFRQPACTGRGELHGCGYSSSPLAPSVRPLTVTTRGHGAYGIFSG